MVKEKIKDQVFNRQRLSGTMEHGESARRKGEGRGGAGADLKLTVLMRCGWRGSRCKLTMREGEGEGRGMQSEMRLSTNEKIKIQIFELVMDCYRVLYRMWNDWIKNIPGVKHIVILKPT